MQIRHNKDGIDELENISEKIQNAIQNKETETIKINNKNKLASSNIIDILAPLNEEERKSGLKPWLGCWEYSRTS